MREKGTAESPKKTRPLATLGLLIWATLRSLNGDADKSLFGDRPQLLQCFTARHRQGDGGLDFVDQ